MNEIAFLVKKITPKQKIQLDYFIRNHGSEV